MSCLWCNLKRVASVQGVLTKNPAYSLRLRLRVSQQKKQGHQFHLGGAVLCRCFASTALLTCSGYCNRIPQIGRLKEKGFILSVLLLLLSCFSFVRLCATPQMAAHQAPPSLGFSRREHWSGLPFPSPIMKVKSESEVPRSCLTLCDPMDCSPPGSPVPGILQARTLEWVAISFSNHESEK